MKDYGEMLTARRGVTSSEITLDPRGLFIRENSNARASCQVYSGFAVS